MLNQCNVDNLADEYKYLSSLNDDEVVASLVLHHEWTKEASLEVVNLAKSKGTFLLRNALALAIVLDIEDGDQGF